MRLLRKRAEIVGLPALMLAVAELVQAATAKDVGKPIDHAFEPTGTTADETKESLGVVAEETGTFIDDSAITTGRIKAEILGDPTFDVLQIHVTKMDAVVSSAARSIPSKASTRPWRSPMGSIG